MAKTKERLFNIYGSRGDKDVYKGVPTKKIDTIKAINGVRASLGLGPFDPRVLVDETPRPANRSRR